MKRLRLTDDQVFWLRENVPGHLRSDTFNTFNKVFKTSFTFSQLKNFCGKHRIKTGPIKHIFNTGLFYTEEKLDWLRAHVPGHHYIEVVQEFNKAFNCNRSVEAIKNICHKNNISSGFTGRFKKGQIPPNKGKKGICHPGAVRTQFKKGNIPPNIAEKYSIVKSTDGFWKIKIGNVNEWEMLSHFLWRCNYPDDPIDPKTERIIYIDGNAENCNLQNLVKVTTYELLQLNRCYSDLNTNKELRKVALMKIRLQKKIREVGKNAES